MKIHVCVKQVPASNETLLDPVTHTIIREGTQSILNPFDAYAVEEAVRIKARCGGTVTAFTMGIPAAEGILRRVIAVGADDAVLLTDRAFAGSDTLATARTLAAAIRKKGMPDLILCGKMATDGDTAQVGPMLAECLSIPHVSDVAEIESVNEEKCTVRKMTDDGYVRLEVRLPALLTVLKEINIPRLPSVSGVLRGEKAGVGRMTREDLGIDPETTGLKGSATRVVSTERPVPARETVWIEGTPEAQAGQLKAGRRLGIRRAGNGRDPSGGLRAAGTGGTAGRRTGTNGHCRAGRRYGRAGGFAGDLRSRPDPAGGGSGRSAAG